MTGMNGNSVLKSGEDKITVSTIGAKKAMDVNLAGGGDIQIGAVEIKDATTDTRATVDSDGLHVSIQYMPIVTVSQSGSWDINDISGTISLPTGASTSAKQLADDHNVTVSNMIPAVETGLATSANQTNGSQKIQIVDSSGNVVSASEDPVDGQYHLAVTSIQDVKLASSSSTNLAAGATWSAEPISTFGVVGLQWNLNTDQNCTIYSEESEGSHTGMGTVATNGTTTLTGTSTVFERAFVVGDTISVSGETDRVIATIVSDTELTVTSAFSTTDTGLTFTHFHWDISYPFDFIYKAGQKGEGETVQATNAYWRLRVVNEGTAATTFFRVSGVLCPVATPLPSSLTDDRRLKTETHIAGNADRHVWVNPTSELAISPVYRMVGTSFDGTVLDPNFWTPTYDAGPRGTITQGGGAVTLETSAATNSFAKYVSVRKARFVAGSAQLFTAGMGGTIDPIAGNLRRIGAYDTNNGFFFELDGTTFSVGTRKATSDSLVNSGSFNGDIGISWIPTTGVFYKMQIEFTPLAVNWYVNGKKLHSIKAPMLSDTLTLPITMENINTTNNTNIDFICVGAYIARQGELVTNPTYKHIPSSGTYNCKIGAGMLHGIAINNPSAACNLTVYDNTSAAGATIAIMALTTKVITPFFMNYNLPFSTGLTIVTSAASDFTIIYE